MPTTSMPASPTAELNTEVHGIFDKTTWTVTYVVHRGAGTSCAIGGQIIHAQKVFKGVFNPEPEFKIDGSQFDHLFAPDEEVWLGKLKGRVLHVPGHTPACVAYQFGDAVFVGDTLFMPDVGTARCDFPGGDARMLYASTRQKHSRSRRHYRGAVRRNANQARRDAGDAGANPAGRANQYTRDPGT